MFKLLIYGFLLYLLYKIVFELVIPVGKATSQVKDKIREMQEQQRAQQANPPPPPVKETRADTPRSGDYIEYEEIK